MTTFVLRCDDVDRNVAEKIMGAAFMDFVDHKVLDENDNGTYLLVATDPLKNRLVLHCGWNEPTSSDDKIETKVKSIIGDDKLNFSVGDFLEEYSDVPIVNKNYPTHMIASYVFNQLKTRESGHCVLVPGITERDGFKRHFLIEQTDDETVFKASEFIWNGNDPDYGHYTDIPPSSWNNKIFKVNESFRNADHLHVEFEYNGAIRTFDFPGHLHSPAHMRIFDIEK